MTRDEMIAAIRKANGKRRRPQLCERLHQRDAAEVFHALFPIAADAQRHGPAYDAACLLFVVKPACPIPCKEAIRALLPQWDVSIEEVPWYLAGHFGEEAVFRAIEELHTEPLSEAEGGRLEAVRYWAAIYFTLTQEEIQEYERRPLGIDG